MSVQRRVFLLSLLCSAGAGALGRIPYQGTLRLAFPWRLRSIDPHDANDALAAFFAPALFDTLYRTDDRGRVFPSLADGLPEETRTETVVRWRDGLVTARGRKLTSRDVEFSVQRAALRGAYPLLRSFGQPKRSAQERAIVFPRGSSQAVSRALASPLTGLIPRSFTPDRPDGTGAFRGEFTNDSFVLHRNPRAARGAAYLERIEISNARDLAEALRRFETQELDVGWLGRGLHRVRPGSELFSGPHLGWVVLHTSKALGRWGAPGIAQRLLDGIFEGRLARFGLGLPRRTGNGLPYQGPPAELWVEQGSSYLLELGTALAELLGTPGHEITLVPKPPPVLRSASAAGTPHFRLQIVRKLGDSPRERQLSLLAAEDRRLSLRPAELPPTLRGLDVALHTTQSLSLGIVGELRVVAATIDRFRELEDWDLGRVWMDRTPSP